MMTRTVTGLAVAWLATAGALALAQGGVGDPFHESNKAAPLPPLKSDEKWTPKEVTGKVRKASEAIDFTVSVEPKAAKRGQTVRVSVVGEPRKGWYTYSMTQRTPEQTGPAVSTFKVSAPAGLQPLGPIEESPPAELVKVPGVGAYYEHKTKFTWSFDVLVSKTAPVGKIELPFVLSFQVCSTGCIPGDYPLKASIDVLAGDPVDTPAAVQERASTKFPPPATVVGSEGAVAKGEPKAPAESSISAGSTMAHDHAESIERVRKQIVAQDAKPASDLWTFILTGMFWGFVSLITPCVFPMIPITVSFFLKQSEKENHRPVTMALIYCGTIVVVLTIAAVALLNFFRFLSINPLMNFGLGLLFIFFALSLFGMYEIELPSFMARYTSERESQGGIVGTIFMALTFTIISFACVAPFLGGFGGTANSATRPLWHTVLGGLAFSLTFASPFFILALFPTLLKAMPKSGAWLNSVKVVMGFLELAAALKFFRAGELVLPSPPGIFTFDLVLGLWVALCLLCGCYLLGVYRLPHDSPVEHLTVPRLLFALAFFGLGVYLVPALVSKPVENEPARPNGAVFAWVNSFLLPEARATKGEIWNLNLEQAIAEARDYRQRTGKAKLIFIDFTGEVCTNCSLNENNIFPKPEIRELFKPYILVKVYCDTVPLKYYAPEDRAAAEAGRRTSDAKINQDFQAKTFDGVELPLYVILEPLADGTIKVLAKFDEGLIRSEAQFADFLRQPLEASGAKLASR